MTEHDQIIENVIQAAGGELVGRIRLQKVVYLLDQKGLNSGASFHYYHYGPYSRLMDAAIEKAKAFRGVTESHRPRVSDGATFSVFVVEKRDLPDQVGNLSSATVTSLVRQMASYSSTVLELAATIHWLAFHELVIDWRAELRVRKGTKTDGGRMDTALVLLRELSLAPTT